MCWCCCCLGAGRGHCLPLLRRVLRRLLRHNDDGCDDWGAPATSAGGASSTSASYSCLQRAWRQLVAHGCKGALDLRMGIPTRQLRRPRWQRQRPCLLNEPATRACMNARAKQ